MIGKTLAHYEILEKIASGGMGNVYRARDTRLGRDVAIKFLTDEAGRDPVKLQRFTSEARLASSLNHPNIITLYEIGDSDEGPYIVTEYIQGRTLKQIMAEEEVSADECINIMLQAAEGLAKAHEAGIVHRDLKPANIMVSDDGFVKILDFGLAKLHSDSELAEHAQHDLTMTGTVVGTVAYIAPERLYGAPADARSDVFSLAVVWHELLYGVHPFVDSSVTGTLKSILHAQPRVPTGEADVVPDEVAGILRKALSKEPSERFSTSRELADAMRLWAPVVSPDTGMARRKRRERRRGWQRLAVLGLAVTIAALAVRWWPERQRTLYSEDKLAVAVLPTFDNSRDPELEHAGIERILADLFVHVLSSVGELYVISPLRLEGIAQGRGRSLEEASTDLGFARAVSQEAQASAMLTSKLSRVGARYLLTATLTRIENEQLMGTFEASSTDPEEFLSDVTRGMRTAIEKRFTAAEEESEHSPGATTSSLDAYAHYVRGMNLMNLARWEQAREEFLAAVEIDPGMALAWSELACAYSFSEEDESKVKAAQREAEKRLEGLPRKESWWIELNGLWLGTGDGESYLEEMGRYLREYPDDRTAYFYGGLAEQWLNGNCSEALRWFERAYELTPFYYPITKGLVDCHLDLDQKDRAIVALERYLGHARAPAHGRAWAEGRLESLRAES